VAVLTEPPKVAQDAGASPTLLEETLLGGAAAEAGVADGMRQIHVRGRLRITGTAHVPRLKSYYRVTASGTGRPIE
jgi:hypothetical protein